MIETNYKYNNMSIAYEITDSGYRIYLNGVLWITQEGNDYHCLVQNGTFEDSCLEHIKTITESEEKAIAQGLKIEENFNDIFTHLNEIDEYHLEVEFKNAEAEL